MFSAIFVAATKIIFRYDFVAPFMGLLQEEIKPPHCIRGYKGQNSTGTRCRGFLALESRCRGFLVLESRCRGFLSSEKTPWNHDVVAYLSPFLDVVVFP